MKEEKDVTQHKALVEGMEDIGFYEIKKEIGCTNPNSCTKCKCYEQDGDFWGCELLNKKALFCINK